VDEQVDTDVSVVNGILDEIAKINEYIAKAELVKPYSAVDLRDQRQAKLEELSKYIDVQFGPVTGTDGNPDPNGLGQIFVKSGDIDLIDRKNVLGKFEYDNGELKFNAIDNNKDRTFTDETLPNGKIGSQILASTGSVQTARDEIELLRTTLKDQVNGAYTPAEFFKITDDRISLEVSDIQTGLAGSNSIALAVAALGTNKFAALDNATFTAFFNKTVTTVAQQLSSTNIRLEDQKLSEQNALNSRDQYSGVSQDEEITDMMKFQRSFQASARHINVLDTLLEQVVNRLGVG
jgi:flagellar hook-associated protein 1 FlgK